MSDISIVGAGGHAKVVLEALLAGQEEWGTIAILDENEIFDSFWKKAVSGIQLCPSANLSTSRVEYFHVAIGGNSTREIITDRLAENGAEEVCVFHSCASISTSATMGGGTFIAAGSVIGASSQFGRGCIVNHNAVVDHDCRIGAFSHVAPGAVLCGGVTLGARVLVGAGSIVKPGIEIGDDCVIGCGSVVINNVSEGTTVAGNPARDLHRANS